MRYLMLTFFAFLSLFNFNTKHNGESKNLKKESVNSDVYASVRGDECTHECFIIERDTDLKSVDRLS